MRSFLQSVFCIGVWVFSGAALGAWFEQGFVEGATLLPLLTCLFLFFLLTRKKETNPLPPLLEEAWIVVMKGKNTLAKAVPEFHYSETQACSALDSRQAPEYWETRRVLVSFPETPEKS
jgi:hypothetical protein